MTQSNEMCCNDQANELRAFDSLPCCYVESATIKGKAPWDALQHGTICQGTEDPRVVVSNLPFQTPMCVLAKGHFVARPTDAPISRVRRNFSPSASRETNKRNRLPSYPSVLHDCFCNGCLQAPPYPRACPILRFMVPLTSGATGSYACNRSSSSTSTFKRSLTSHGQHLREFDTTEAMAWESSASHSPSRPRVCFASCTETSTAPLRVEDRKFRDPSPEGLDGDRHRSRSYRYLRDGCAVHVAWTTWFRQSRVRRSRDAHSRRGSKCEIPHGATKELRRIHPKEVGRKEGQAIWCVLRRRGVGRTERTKNHVSEASTVLRRAWRFYERSNARRRRYERHRSSDAYCIGRSLRCSFARNVGLGVGRVGEPALRQDELRSDTSARAFGFCLRLGWQLLDVMVVRRREVGVEKEPGDVLETNSRTWRSSTKVIELDFD